MYKFLAVVAILGLTACGSSESAEVTTTADSTAAVVITADSVVADSTVADSLAK